MIRIAICDEEKYFTIKVKEIVAGYMELNHILYEIDILDSGEELVELGIEVAKYKIVFLNGIETAKLIRKVTEEIFIVFISENINYALDGYKVAAIRYLLKGRENFIETLYECLDAILYQMNYVKEKKEIQFHECRKVVQMNYILYIESKLHKLEYHIMEDELCVYTKYGKLDDLEKEYTKYGFTRIHQSFLVNMKYIKSVERYEVFLSNGIKLAIPKARYKYVKESFAVYRKEI